jgi:hypothetical protein
MEEKREVRLHLNSLVGLALRLPSPQLGGLRRLVGKYVSPPTFGLRQSFRFLGDFAARP